MSGVSVFAHEKRHLMDCRVKDCLIADVFTTLFMKCSFSNDFHFGSRNPICDLLTVGEVGLWSFGLCVLSRSR